MKKAKAIIFDMDGVIFDTEKLYLETWSKIFKEYGYTMTKEIYTSVMGRGRENVSRIFLNIYGNTLPIEEMYDKKDKLLMEIIDKKGVDIKKGVKEILAFLKENNYKIALATSANKDRAMKQFKGKDIQDKFDVMVYRDDIINLKPDPEIFLKAASKLDIEPKKCIVIEDSSAGIKGAYRADMIGIHVEDLKEADEDIIKYCYKNFKDLLEIKEYLEDIIKIV